MIGRVRRLVAGEFLKLYAQPFFYFALVLVFVLTLMAELLVPIFRGQKETLWRSYHSLQLFAYGFKWGLQVATFVLLIFSGMLFAGEFDRGTIKNLLTRPITRLEFFLAKCVTVTTLAALLYVFVFFVSMTYALWRGDLGPVWDDTQFIIMRSHEEIVAHARKAFVITFLPFLAVGFLGILVSNLTESSGYAVAIALLVFIFGSLVSGWLSDRTQQKIFLYYGSYAFDKLLVWSEGGTTRWNPDIDARRLYVSVPLLTIAAFVPSAFGIFRWRNISA
ncbi:MAG TPA: ABC transporter permease [Planctomycetota bacterium]|nr:ABC transporter permease [Planctomycetota bacterium]